jgi:hypothetical protein
MAENRGSLELSVVVAVADAGPNLAQCLAALQKQLSPSASEILVIDGSRTGSAPRWSPRSPGVRILRPLAGTDVPGLWQAGIDASCGKIIALLVESCVPAPDWAERMLCAHQAEWPVVGGAIDLAPQAGLVDSAIYFCRYSRYLPPFSPQFLDDLPGNNCSYKRAALAGVREEMAEGFWETFVHRKMRSRGDRLYCDPGILVQYAGPASAASFLKARFNHGRYFAARRARELNRTQRILRGCAFPVVPLLMMGRIAARVWAKRRYRGRFLASLPLLAAFLAAWSAGESFGYLRGPSQESIRENKEESRVLREVG